MNLTPTPITAGRVLQFSDQWRSDAHLVDLDRAELLRHYNGGALEGDVDDITGQVKTWRANMLLGYKFLSRPVEQLLSVYDEGLGCLEVEVCNPDLPASRRRVVRRTARQCDHAVRPLPATAVGERPIHHPHQDAGGHPQSCRHPSAGLRPAGSCRPSRGQGHPWLSRSRPSTSSKPSATIAC